MDAAKAQNAGGSPRHGRLTVDLSVRSKRWLVGQAKAHHRPISAELEVLLIEAASRPEPT
ncbi:MAG: hypothetical protein ACYDCJ_12370 [Gammaproteobacteria bacterium]